MQPRKVNLALLPSPAQEERSVGVVARGAPGPCHGPTSALLPGADVEPITAECSHRASRGAVSARVFSGVCLSLMGSGNEKHSVAGTKCFSRSPAYQGSARCAFL